MRKTCWQRVLGEVGEEVSWLVAQEYEERHKGGLGGIKVTKM